MAFWALSFLFFVSFPFFTKSESTNPCEFNDLQHECICRRYFSEKSDGGMELSCTTGNALQYAIKVQETKADLVFVNIIITDGSIGIIRYDDIESFSKVEHLNLQRNEISSIEDEAFKNKNYLQDLDLSFNNLQILQDNTFNHPNFLHNLSLSNNNLHTIEAGAFSRLEYLLYLDLSFNYLTHINGFFLPLKSLNYLNLTHNRITSIANNSFNTLIHLQKLDLSFNSLKVIPHNLFHRLKSLNLLSLAMNALETLEEDLFKGNIMLEKVNLTGNLWICDKKLLPLNDSLKKYEAYKEGAVCVQPLDLRNYTIQHALEILNLEIRIQENPTCNATMCNCTISKDKLVVTVDCSNKGFTRLPDVVPYKTKVLNLYNNKIKSLNIDHINATLWSDVSFLYLNNNVIDTSKGLEGNWLLRNLVALHLSNNRLTEVPIHILEQIRGGLLDELYLAGNPWTCDCNTVRFQTWLQDNYRVVRNFDGVCCSSDSGIYADLPIYKLKKSQLCPQQVTLVNYLDVLNSLMAIGILLIIIKLSYDYWLQKRTGKLPRFFSLNLGN